MSRVITYDEVKKQLNNALEICEDCVLGSQNCYGCDILFQIRKHNQILRDIEILEKGFKDE